MGIVLVMDMAGMTASHALRVDNLDKYLKVLQIFLRFRIQIYDLTYYEQMNPVVAKKAMTVWQDAYPSRCCCPFHINGKKMSITCLIHLYRPKAMHFVNMPPVIESVFRMMQVR